MRAFSLVYAEPFGEDPFDEDPPNPIVFALFWGLALTTTSVFWAGAFFLARKIWRVLT